MSENLELVKRIHADWERGDYSESSWAAEDIEYQTPSLPPSRVRGRAAMSASWGDWLRGWREFFVRAEEFREHGDKVLVLMHFEGEGRASGLPVRQQLANVFTIRGGEVVRLATYEDPALASAEFSGEEE